LTSFLRRWLGGTPHDPPIGPPVLQPDSGPPIAFPPVSDQDERLLAALRAGEDAAFRELIDRYQAVLVRLALIYVADLAAAEDVVQETWIGVLRGLDRFEGRSSLKTWLFRILTNRAKTRGQRDRRSVPFSSLAAMDEDGVEFAVDPVRFGADNGWISAPANWEGRPEERLLTAETRSRIEAAIAALPTMQREVITLRDVEGWAAVEVCNLLALSETNQRVLLHRARCRVRSALERYLDTE